MVINCITRMLFPPLLTDEEITCILGHIDPTSYAPGCRSTGRAVCFILKEHPRLGCYIGNQDLVDFGDWLYEKARFTLLRPDR